MILIASSLQTAAFHVNVSSRPRRMSHWISFPPPSTPSTSSFELRSTVSDDVACVSVCTAELCQCQGDEYGNGGAADALIANLRARQLPFPVEESGCLGACGMGTTVAIDYHDGTANLVAGLDQTLTELGISGMVVQEESSSTTNNNDNVLSLSTAVPNSGIPVVSTVPGGMDAQVFETDDYAREQIAELIAESEVPKQATEKKPVSVETIQCSTPQPPRRDTPELVDGRDRRRADAAKETASATNPWANMAGYLAKKAAEKLFGE